MSNAAYNTKDPRIVRQIGMNALVNSLGSVGMANFFRQFDIGSGDYTKEREILNGNQTADEIYDEIKPAINSLKRQKSSITRFTRLCRLIWIIWSNLRMALLPF